MPVWPSLILRLVVLSLAVSWSSAAHAWVELSVRSANVTIDLERGGDALVDHEILLRLRGGPLKELTIEGIDPDAEPIQDGTITRAHGGQVAGMPIPLTLSAEGGQLRAVLQLKKGIRGGTYLLRARYRAHFAQGSRIVTDGNWSLLRWKSPKFDSGIDSMRLLLRLPHGDRPPHVPGGADGDAVIEAADGVFLATARASGDVDELEIVRPHVARQEEVTWRARLDSAALGLDLPGAAPSAPTVAPPPAAGRLRVDARDLRPWLFGAVAAWCFALLAWLKGRAVGQACARRGAEPRGLLARRPVTRGVVAGTLLGAAVVVAWKLDLPTIAGLLVAACMVVSTALPPRTRSVLRGPGTWAPAAPDVAFVEARTAIPLGARVFDAGHALGFVLFALLLMGFIGGAIFVLRSSPYYGVMVALGAGCLFPLFCTGRSAELPPEPLEAARERLEAIHRRLSARGLEVTPLLRHPTAGGAPDELRLRVTPKRPLRGLVAIELGVDEHRSAAGSITLPFVIVRVQDASPALAAMPAGLLWTRGRDADERVSVLRPKLPTRRLIIALTLDVVSALSVRAGTRAHGATRAARSSGKSDVTSKPAVPSAPAHAT